MPTKTETYAKMADQATGSLTAEVKDWCRFLICAGQFYKYNFLDQVMIYTQRPDATACAEFDLWSVRMDRRIRRGSKGIALLYRTSSGGLAVRYVFDVSDTERRRESSRDPKPWTYRPEYERAVMAHLEESLGMSGARDLPGQLTALAIRSATERWNDFKYEIMHSVHDSRLDGLDEDNISCRFQSAMLVSLAFLLLARCGFDLDAYFAPNDLDCVLEFDTKDAILAIGNAVSESANVILRQVERAIRQYERDRRDGGIGFAGEIDASANDIPTTMDESIVAAGDAAPAEMIIETAAPAADDPAPALPIEKDTAAAGEEKPAAAPVSHPEIPAGTAKPEPVAPVEPEPEESGQLSILSPKPAATPEPAATAVHSFKIADRDTVASGPKARYAANIAAIRLLKQIEAEHRNAAPDEQEILSRYAGWGGVPDAFDESKPEWADEYAELKALLSEEEYASARASVLNSHYTPPVVIRAIWEAIGNMGFKSGNVLEPSMGIGSFFGCLPESMDKSRLYGVELDGISARIAMQLYPKAHITASGFETTDRRDFYDIAVGNVPFGQYSVNDPAYNKHKFSIHNYFLCKALDQLRPGGAMAFVTSRYTMDAKDSAARRYLAERADLLGAIRLPNTAFRASAGTDVVSDILFFKKLDEPNPAMPDWINTIENQYGYPVNGYFDEHPEMILGCPGVESTRYGHDYTVYPMPDADLAQQLREAVGRIRGTYHEATATELDEDAVEYIPAAPGVKNYSYAILDGEVWYRENSVMVRPGLNATALARVKGMVRLRECLHELIQAQMAGCNDVALAQYQKQLAAYYDGFAGRYGLINGRANKLAFDRDASYYLLCSLEILDDDNGFIRKADIFTKRTIRKHVPVDRVDTAQEALAVSIGERAGVDLEYMSRLCGKAEDGIIADLQGMIFKDPADSVWKPADEYLSGHVRKKLRIARRAAEQDPAYQPNVDALIAAQPKDLDASEIEVRLGATWIAPEYVQQFMHETFRTPMYRRDSIRVIFAKATAAWSVTCKSWITSDDVMARTTYGTDRKSAYEILEDTLNLRDVRVYDTVTDPDGKERRVLNSKQTTLAAQKQQMIKDAFRDWIWRDPERRQALTRVYNDTMNAIRPREYDGSNIVFHGINPEITLRPHQLDAIAHVLYGGNTLLAHEVGAGKSFEMIASAMESKYLGLCSKSIFVVPNHLTQQMAAEFLRLYPAANILVTTKRDFEAAKRKKFCARIATGDWDAVIIGHSQFEKIPMSYERQKRIIDDQIADIEAAVAEVKASRGERFTIKEMERMKKNLQARLEKLEAGWKKDKDVISFEQLGVDMMFVDESDAYKNLFLYTKMRNVAGLSTAEAQKSSDMFAKCRYLDELTHGRGIVMATGTPISNSMTEFFTVQRYLQYDRLQELGMGTFDSWASRFGETVTALELAPEGTGYRARTRFARFFHLPELMAIFKEVANIKTADQLDLPVPEAEYHTVVSKPTEHQKALVQELSKRAEKVHSGSVDPHADNMLRITSDGRKLGLDQRLINPRLPDEPGTKVNKCVANILKHWRDGEADRLAQLVFCDIGTPTAGKGGFNIYDDIKSKLIAAGMPPEQIAFIHDADTDERKKTLFAKVRSGQVRVLIGSTAKCGAGMNVQDRLIAIHDADCPWRPRDLTQRAGRIVRQGNMNEKVHIYRYVTESTFDSYLWQTVEAKQKFISQIMTSRTPLRSCEDVDETALSFAEIKALCAGDPRIKERMELDVDVARLRVMKSDYQSKKFRLEDDVLRRFPAEIAGFEAIAAGVQADMETLAAHPRPEDGFAGMKINGRDYLERDAAGEALIDAATDVSQTEPVEIGSYRGLAITAEMTMFGEQKTQLKGAVAYTINLGDSAIGNVIRIDNALAKLPEQLEFARTRIADLERQLEAAKAEAAKPFAMEEELRAKSARLAELDAALNLGKREPEQPAA